MKTNTTVAVNRNLKLRASKKLKEKGVPLSVATNMFFKKIADNEIDIDFINSEKHFSINSEEVAVQDKETAELMDNVGNLYSNE